MAGKRLGWYGFQTSSNCQLPSAAVCPVYRVPLLVGLSSGGRVGEEDGASAELPGRDFRSGALVRLYSTIRASLISHPRIEYYLLVWREPLRHILRHRSLQQVIGQARIFHRYSFGEVCVINEGFGPLDGRPRLLQWRRRSQLQRRGFGNGLYLQKSLRQTTWSVLENMAQRAGNVFGSSNTDPAS